MLPSETDQSPLGAPDQTRQHATLPDTLAIIPMRNTVLFPGAALPITLGRQRSIQAVQEAARANQPIGLVLQRNPECEEPGAGDLYEVGTVAVVIRYMAAANGTHHLVCQGTQRFKIREFLPNMPYPVARIVLIEDADPNDLHTPEALARLLQLQERTLALLQALPEPPAELIAVVRQADSASTLVDLIPSVMDLEATEKQALLETFDLSKRVDRVLEILAHRTEVMRISQDIMTRTQKKLEGRSREMILREQMRTIEKELGEEDGGAREEIAKLRQAIADAAMPEEVENHANKELKRLGQMQAGSAEHSMLQTYLEWLSELPWARTSAGEIDIAAARAILDEDHYGLPKIKRRILEYLAVQKLKPEGKSPILCFVGPPGVGKTSLGQSIARATGRKFVRVSLGGVHDEAEIRGHRRTYIGALPGTIMQAMKKAGTRNPVMMLDEIDKLGHGVHGDPNAALLEVLDPEQNGTFRDNYFAVPFDLSSVMFITTANVIDAIPGPLRDRMEVIELSGYTEEEKLQIARRYLVRRQIEANGLENSDVEVTDGALDEIIRYYTREAGVRNLERAIAKTLRSIAMKVAEGGAPPYRIDGDDVAVILGAHRYERETAMRTSVPGVVTGLAWTPVGGDILFIEATKVPGNGKLILTGQLGEVMKESAQAAFTLIKSRAADLEIDPGLIAEIDIHVHVPAGAIPKDGPSAGVAMSLALASLLTGRRARPDVAMTGEISLRGLVLPVGGIKEKVIAALRAGITEVLLPARNRHDLEDIPKEVVERTRFVWLENIEQAIDEALQERD
ncbi:endopeptidase La [Candidatus Methylospira mobilis]|uniref:Lon protease n=1 Tax=Candidatus Methylospira mobilis TaxID=1808979 RepID=A0A5Q0BPW3_9GAMM|nr:endopeptidase La [Candidatus Methylospira mobilis]QFY44128.1 endopeptidase La [Candidatus Methylospira mobilis]WNV06461.1 endopeptidase La [Candidatus Methylospira mobilis]